MMPYGWVLPGCMVFEATTPDPNRRDYQVAGVPNTEPDLVLERQQPAPPPAPRTRGILITLIAILIVLDG